MDDEDYNAITVRMEIIAQVTMMELVELLLHEMRILKETNMVQQKYIR